MQRRTASHPDALGDALRKVNCIQNLDADDYHYHILRPSELWIMNEKLRTAIAAGAFGLAIAGVVFVGWALMNAVLNASLLTQVEVGASFAGAGGLTTIMAIRK